MAKKAAEEKEERQFKTEVSMSTNVQETEKELFGEQFFEYEIEDQGEFFKLWSVAYGKKHQEAFEQNVSKEKGDFDIQAELMDKLFDEKQTAVRRKKDCPHRNLFTISGCILT